MTDRASSRKRAWRAVGPGNISLIYIYVGIFVLFTIWIPGLWLNLTTVRSVLNISFVVPAMVAIGLLLPLLSGSFDLSIGGTMSAAGITVATLIVSHHWTVVPAVVVAMGVALGAGLLNAVLVVVVGINSFIATLGTGSILAALAEAVSGGNQVTGFPASFSSFGSGVAFGGIQTKVIYLALLAAVLWYVIERTPAGRYYQATGDNATAARLAGVRTQRYVFSGLLVSAVVAGLAGVLETATVGAGTSDLGSPYLLSAFAAAYLGATQFKGRFNVWGTLAAVWVLASGVQGITLALQSYVWLNDLFFGVALVVAVGFSQLLRHRRSWQAARRRAATAERGGGGEASSLRAEREAEPSS